MNHRKRKNRDEQEDWEYGSEYQGDSSEGSDDGDEIYNTECMQDKEEYSEEEMV